MKEIKLIFLLLSLGLITNCASTKTIKKGNHLFEYVDNQVGRTKDGSLMDKYKVYEVNKDFKLKSDKSKITESDNYYSLVIDASDASESRNLTLIKTIDTEAQASMLDLDGKYYTHESSNNELLEFNKSFKYSNFKFGLQALSIPLKFRRALDDGSSFPAQVETGTNIGFAPSLKYEINVFNPTEKVLGKKENKYALSTGILLNLGVTNLKASGNATGLQSDRKAATFTYGTFIMFGFNNINVGWAIGADAVIGEGSSNWKYQNRLWQGLIIGLDILKF